MSVNDEQPPPKPGNAPHSVDLVIIDLHERKKLGTAKYGTPHQFDNGRKHLVDALQESYDLSIYLRAEIEERRDERKRAADMVRMWSTTHRDVISERERLSLSLLANDIEEDP